uniref:Uncharacterized protein AlNc14C126G6823 n=1 Tax=Albugo laibachii Nc14 TaxID=890382 RepID=F0WJV3_9STRA|nr:conserved hypothetical protein [Albugo laibachii Nc14]|eukprot:CCA21555.1 conserved hypothetical protein [Albugo laibachii Nc14]
MEEEQARIERAYLRNLEYIESLDNKRENVVNESGAKAGASKNRSIYVTGLTTYVACKQFEGLCAKIGKVKRIKFYKCERGRLKGDALVTFLSHSIMEKAIEKLDNFEIKPGVVITASAADFAQRKGPKDVNSTEQSDTQTDLPAPEAPVEANNEAKLDEKEQVKSIDPKADSNTPSQTVILLNAWDPSGMQDDITLYFNELEGDIHSECSKFGKVEHVHIAADGSIQVRFSALECAKKCLQVMNKRWFDGRQIIAMFDPSQPADEEDVKLEAFLASIN